MGKIRVVQIGIGHDHATGILDTVLKQQDIYDVCALGVPESEKTDFCERLKNYENKLPIVTVDEALNLKDIDAVIVETEEENLTKYAYAAAKKGFPVHMDKPGGLKLDEFEKLINAAKENKSVLHLGYMYRYNPAINEAIKKARSGEIGEIYAVEAQMNCEHGREKREWLARFPGGMMFFLGCHLIDLIVRIQGFPEEVIPLNRPTQIGGTTAEDYGFAVLKYKNGISFAKTCAAEPGGYSRRQLVICGSEGTIEMKPLESFDENGDIYTQTAEVNKKKADVDWCYRAPIVSSKPYGRYDYMMSDFCKMVCSDLENPFDYDYELKLYKTLLKACGVR